uniref:Uncharacterized protein n=1 Tax=Romanomermis culicivorax TaxID=13658 RepID=A0A915JX46_ROMCU
MTNPTRVKNLYSKPAKNGIMSLKIGISPTIVVSSIDVANSSQKKMLVEGKRKIVNHHVSPALQVEMLNQLWSK